VGVGFRGGKIRLGGGNEFFDIVVEGALVLFSREHIVGPRFQHQVASRVGLGVEGIQRDEPAFEIQIRKELSCHGDLVGLGVHDGAAQVILAGHAVGGEHALAAAMFGLLAIQGDQFVFGGRTAQPLLNGQQSLLEFSALNLLDQPPEGGLAGSRVAPVAFANTQGAPLSLTEFARKFG